MTSAQVEYLKHLETKRHNLETESQGRSDVETRKQQADASTVQADAAKSSVPARYLDALGAGSLVGLGLKTAVNVAGRAKNAAATKNLFKQAAKTFGSSTATGKSTNPSSLGSGKTIPGSSVTVSEAVTTMLKAANREIKDPATVAEVSKLANTIQKLISKKGNMNNEK